MQILTKETLDAAIKKCQENEYYKIIVVTEYVNSHKDVVDYLRQFECDGPGVLNNPYVHFSNGSIIRMLSLASNTRGHRANLVLCVPKIFYDKNSYKFMAMEANNHNFKLFKDEVGND